MTLPDSGALVDHNGSGLAYAPDGSVFAYTSRLGLMLRAADKLDAVPVPGARRGVSPFFSRRWPVARVHGWREGHEGAARRRRAGDDLRLLHRLLLLLGQRRHRPLSHRARRQSQFADPDGGVGPGWRPYEIAHPDSGSTEALRGPILVPGTRTVLFAAFTGSSSRLAALNLDTHAITVFDQPGFTPQWVAAGFVTLASSDGSLIAAALRCEKGSAERTSRDITRDVSQPDAFVSRVAVSASGAILYPQSGGNAPRRLALVGRSGSASLLPGEGRVFASPRFSPDGRRLALGITDQAGARDVWVLDIAQRTWSRLTTSGINNRPAWTPDGRRLVYSSNDDLWWIAADGSGRPESLLVANGNRFAGTVTPDGRGLVFQEQASDRSGIRSMTFDSAPASRLLIPGTFGESAPALSPDGQVAGVPVRRDGADGGVRPALSGARRPGAGLAAGRHRGGLGPQRAGAVLPRGRQPRWWPRSPWVPPSRSPGRRLLFTGAFASGDSYREYDVAPDDQHFVMLSGGAGRSVLIGLQHAFDRLAPGR